MRKSVFSVQPLVPRLDALLFMILFVSVLTLGSRMLNIDGDLPRHLLMGKIILETGHIPTQEIFSYVYEGRPYTPHEWLAGVIYYLVYRALDLNGVVLLAGILIAASFSVVYAEAVRQGAGRFSMLSLTVLGALVTSIHWVPRPHLFTMFFLALWIVLAERIHRSQPVNIWLFPLLMLLWANVHAEFIAGFLILLAYLVGYSWRYIFGRSQVEMKRAAGVFKIAMLSFLASLLNPAGLRTWEIVAGYLGNRYLLSRIAETRPPDFAQADYWPLLALIAIAALLLVAKRRSYEPAHFFLAAGFGAMSLMAARNAHLAGVVFPFLLAGGLVGNGGLRLLERLEVAILHMERQAKGTALPILVTILMGAVLLLGHAGRANRFEPSVLPVEAVSWLEEHPQAGRMFNAFNWGGYLLFYLWPEQKVFIESQTDVSGDVTEEYEKIITLQDGWQDIFEKYDVTWAIIPIDWDLAQKLSSYGWEPVYQDATAIILVKP